MAIKLDRNIPLKNLYKILFICFVGFGLYYPSIFSQFNSIDDGALISHLEDTDFNLFDLIIPGKSHYYRPVVWFTFFFDKFAWGLEPSFMHLENIIIHVANAVMIFMIGCRLASSSEQRLELPLLASLYFTVHPINTEAVCWVAGRTDPLATLFILAAALCLTIVDQNRKYIMLTVSAGLIFLGCLSKEVAFFFFPPALLSTLRYSNSSENGKFPWRSFFYDAAPFMFFALLYLYLRHVALASGDSSVDILLKQQTGIVQSAATSLTTFGFYVKKLFIPLPLNFAIISYSSHYIWLGIAALVLACWLLFLKRCYYYFFITSLFLTLPAVMISVKRVAWTPVAERYLYAPAAFFAIALVGAVFYLPLKKQFESFLALILITIITFFAFITVQRNITWQDNYLLFKDAVAGSPDFPRIRNEYGIALKARGDQAEAARQFEAGKQMDKGYPLAFLNLANMKFIEGKPEEALQMLAGSYKNKKSALVNTLKLEARIYESLLYKSKNRIETRTLIMELVENYQFICLREKDPYLYYRSGQLLLSVGEREKAAELFTKAFKEAPEGAFYKLPAKQLSDRLSKRQ